MLLPKLYQQVNIYINEQGTEKRGGGLASGSSVELTIEVKILQEIATFLSSFSLENHKSYIIQEYSK